MKYVLTIYCLLFSVFSYAQQPYSWDLTVEDGLPSLEVYDLYEDSKGYMWIGTDKGLCKYNGNDFFYYKNEKELGDALSGIQEDLEGRIWVRNFKDQIFYVENDSLHYFELPHKMNIQDFLVDSKGAIWIIEGTQDSLHCYNIEGHWKTWAIDHSDEAIIVYSKGVFSIVEGKDNTIYLSSRKGVFKCVDDQILFLTNKGLTIETGASNWIPNTYLFKDRENRIFLLQSEKERVYQVSQLENDQINFISNEIRSFFYKTRNHNLKFDEENRVWQLTLNSGLGPVLNSNFTGEVDTTLLLFPKEGISDFVIDREGNYWVGSLSKGVHIIPNLKIEQYTAANSILKHDKVDAIERREEDALIISTSKGVAFSYFPKENRITDEIEISKGECKQIYWDQKKLLINGDVYQEVYTYLSDPIKEYKYTFLGRPFRSSFIYKKDWIIGIASTGVGGYKMSETLSLEEITNEFFSKIPVNKSVISRTEKTVKNFTKIASYYGISDEENDRILIARDDSLICYTEDALSYPILDEKGKTIRGIYMERSINNLIFICTVNSGIYVLNKELKVINHYTSQDGLMSNRVKKIKVDGDNLWLLTTEGVQCFNRKTKESHIYTTVDGLPTHEIKDIAIVSGKIWLSTAKGLVSFDTNMSSKNEVAPLVYIKNVSIHDKDTLLSDVYNLSYRQNNISIEVEGLAYRSRGAFRYKYRMLGIDTIWRYQESRTDFIRFPQLQSGEYTFEVKVVNEDGVESTNAAQVVFNISLPYWRTWWFSSFIIFFIGLIVLIMVRFQLQQVRLENQNSNLKMEALQSQMNPHFIFNVLTAVQNLWLQHKNELAMDLQSNFAKLLRKIFQYSSKRAITIEQVEEFLDNYLNLEQIRFENMVDIDFQIEKVLIEEEYVIPPLLIQPVIENSFKHGLFHKQTDLKLSIHLKYQGAYLYCCVEDNGVGRKNKDSKKKIKRSSGLGITKERLAILQERIIKKKHPYDNLKITDLKQSDGTPAGTKVELWIPFI